VQNNLATLRPILLEGGELRNRFVVLSISAFEGNNNKPNELIDESFPRRGTTGGPFDQQNTPNKHFCCHLHSCC
jgi:hypothetical protein